MSLQEEHIERVAELAPGNVPDVVTDVKADGITVENRSGYDCVVAVVNQLLGISSVGYVKNGQNVVMPAGWAWWDVYALFESGNSGVFLENKVLLYSRFNWKKTHVGYRDTVTIS